MNRLNAHADLLMGSRWAHTWAHLLVRFNICMYDVSINVGRHAYIYTYSCKSVCIYQYVYIYECMLADMVGACMCIFMYVWIINVHM